MKNKMIHLFASFLLLSLSAVAQVTSVGTIGASPNANGATITGSTINLEPASATYGGVITNGTQTIAGAKTFTTSVSTPSLVFQAGTVGYNGELNINAPSRINMFSNCMSLASGYYPDLPTRFTRNTGTRYAGMTFEGFYVSQMFFGLAAGSDDFIFSRQNEFTNELVRITNSGNVGIGTSSPGAKLHTADNSGVEQMRIEYNSTNQMNFYMDGNNKLGISPQNITTPSLMNFSGQQFEVGLAPFVAGSSSSGYPGCGYNFSPTTTNTVQNYRLGGDPAYRINFGAGERIDFQTAPSGTAGTNITWDNRMSILQSNGNVGIGTTTPSEKLHVNGNAILGSTVIAPAASNADLSINSPSGYYYPTLLFNANGATTGNAAIQYYDTRLYISTVGSMRGVIGNNWLIGTTTDYGQKLQVSGDAMVSGGMGVGTTSPSADAKLDVNGNIFSSGKIAIGTTDMTKISSYSLVVNGDAIFNKAKVKLYANWPDFVFEEKYGLMPIDQLEQYIKTNKHLPNIPTTAEVTKDGLDLGNNQTLLLQKIEELTLYIIQQSKKIELLQKDNDAIKAKLDLPVSGK